MRPRTPTRPTRSTTRSSTSWRTCPGAVPNTSTYALTDATLPYAGARADTGWSDACRADQSLALGRNTHDGLLTNKPVGEAVGIEAVDPSTAIGVAV